MRIVSLVPSLTELLFDLGLSNQLVGVTRFCIHPPEAKLKNKIGGTKTLKIDRIISLKPNLVIANKEENTKKDVEALQAKNINVLVSNLNSLKDVFDFIEELGQLTEKKEEAELIIDRLNKEFTTLKKAESKSVLYLIWHQPTMSVGTDTFINHILKIAGYRNIIEKKRYPEIREDEITALNPDYVFLSSEPYPFENKHISHFQKLLPHAQIELVDGEMFSWYGSRLLRTPKYLNELHRKLQ